MTEVYVKIFGRVQGIFFRSETQEKANELGVKGWVKNEPDGTVTAVAQGDDSAIQKFLMWCKTGPSAAQVENIEVTTNENPENIFENFTIEY